MRFKSAPGNDEMLCAICRGILAGAIYTVSCLRASGRAHTVNLCRFCIANEIGRTSLNHLDDILDRSGWVQPPLPEPA